LASDDEPEILTPQEAADFLRVQHLPCSTKSRQDGCREGGWKRNGEGFSRSMPRVDSVGLDRHDLKLYDRGAERILKAAGRRRAAVMELQAESEQAVYGPSEDQNQTEPTGKAKKSRLCF
jgi:hypothetical protein